MGREIPQPITAREALCWWRDRPTEADQGASAARSWGAASGGPFGGAGRDRMGVDAKGEDHTSSMASMEAQTATSFAALQEGFIINEKQCVQPSPYIE